jgi:hypothetical protein
MKWAGLYQHIFHLKWAGLDKHIFHLNWLDFTSTFFIRNWLNSLAHCSFQIGLDSSDSSFLFQVKKSKAARSGTQLGSILRIITSYFILFSFRSLIIKQNRGRSRPKFWNSRSPPYYAPFNAIICLSVCGSRAGFGEWHVCVLQRADCPHALACGLPARLGNRLARDASKRGRPLHNGVSRTIGPRLSLFGRFWPMM